MANLLIACMVIPRNISTLKTYNRAKLNHEIRKKIDNVSKRSTHINIYFCFSVLLAPRIDLEKGPTFVEEDTAVTLPICHVTGSPTPEVKWSKVGGSLPSQSEVEDGQLKIVNAKKQDAGLYKCEATNRVGFDEAETSVEVIEFVKPPEVLNTTEGADKLVECRVTTKPAQQTVKWLKSNDVLPGLTDGTLQLTNIQEAADGKYTCSVSVGKLTFVAEMQLNVRGKCHDMELTTFSQGRHIAGGQGLCANF